MANWTAPCPRCGRKVTLILGTPGTIRKDPRTGAIVLHCPDCDGKGECGPSDDVGPDLAQAYHARASTIPAPSEDSRRQMYRFAKGG